MSQESRNQYDDQNTRICERYGFVWESDVTIPEDVVTAYMDWQQRIYDENNHRNGFNHAMYQHTEDEFQQAYNAGHEMARRAHIVGFSDCDPCQSTSASIAFRANTGIRFPCAIAHSAFMAGFRAYEN